MRKFNITGSIVPKLHYYVGLTPQRDKLMALVGEGTYFVINRPRQFGKTTMLKFFAQRLRASGNFAVDAIPDNVVIGFLANLSEHQVEEKKVFAWVV